MTKKEFIQKFDSAFETEANKIFTDQSIGKILEPYIDQDGNVPLDKLPSLALIESAMITKRVLKSVLENVLQFDD